MTSTVSAVSLADTEVVRYVEHSRAKLVGERPQQLEHLRLHADVQGRGGLVREEQTGRFATAIAITTRWRIPPEN